MSTFGASLREPVRPASRSLAGVRRVDWLLVLATGVLCTIGCASVYAVTRNTALGGAHGTAYLYRDVVNILVGVGLAAVAALFPYRSLSAYALVLHAGACVVLLAVLSPAGSTINGAHAWFSLGPVQLEPSEFVKLTTALAMAAVLARPRDGDSPPDRADLLTALAVAAVPAVLILAEPALGVAIVIAVIALVCLAVGAVPARWIAGLVAVAVLGVTAVLGLHLLKPYQEQRFTAFADPQASQHSSVGYQTEQSEIAIGSGGLTGQGFLRGSQTNGRFVPEQQTDFVFTVVAEEGGFAVSGALLLALGLLFWRGFTIARAAVDPFGRITAAAITVWLAFQAFTNIGMTLGIMPVTGLPLPFVSYGGSAMFIDLLAVGLLLKIGAQRG